MWPRTSGSFQAWRQQKQEQWGGQPRQEQGGRYSGGNMGWGGGWEKSYIIRIRWDSLDGLTGWYEAASQTDHCCCERSRDLSSQDQSFWLLSWFGVVEKESEWWLVNKLYIGEWIAAGCEGHKRAVIASIHQLSPPPLNMYHQICNVFLQRVFLKCTEKRRILNSHYFRFSVLKPHWRKGREYYNSVNPI